jgi:hypothetical protein
MKKLDSNQKSELDHLKERSLLILNFIGNQLNADERLNYLEKFKEIICDAHERDNLKGLKMVVRDVTEWAKGLNQMQIDRLDKMLIEKFGDDLNYNKQKIEEVISKNNIEKPSEYRLLFDYFEQIYSDDSKKEEVVKIRHMLEAYQKRTGKA